MNATEHVESGLGRHCVIDSSARIARDVAVGAHSVIATGVSIGTGSVLGAGVHVAEGVQIGNGVSIDASVVFAHATPATQSSPTIVRDGAAIGAGSVVCAGLVIDSKAIVRPGSVVTRSVPPAAIVEGNPAAIVGYADADQATANAMQSSAVQGTNAVDPTPVKGVTVHTFPIVRDLRGDLTAGEFEKQIPFTPRRYFMVFGVPSREVRGAHAHRECHQFLVCVRGNCAVVADDGTRRVEVALDSPNRGVYLPPMTWGVQYKYSIDALLLVFASHHYMASDYIRDYAEFLALSAQCEA